MWGWGVSTTDSCRLHVFADVRAAGASSRRHAPPEPLLLPMRGGRGRRAPRTAGPGASRWPPSCGCVGAMRCEGIVSPRRGGMEARVVGVVAELRTSCVEYPAIQSPNSKAPAPCIDRLAPATTLERSIGRVDGFDRHARNRIGSNACAAGPHQYTLESASIALGVRWGVTGIQVSDIPRGRRHLSHQPTPRTPHNPELHRQTRDGRRMEEPPPPPSTAAAADGASPPTTPAQQQAQALQQEFKALRAALAAAVQALKGVTVPPLLRTTRAKGDSAGRGEGEQQSSLDVPALGRAVLGALPPDTPEERERWAAEGACVLCAKSCQPLPLNRLC